MSDGQTIDRGRVTAAFNAYVADYDPSDPKISLKIAHSYRVAALCERIAGEVGALDIDLCWLMGMLHDIGRFEQIRRYDTFVDALSVDHAALGASLLFGDGLIERFAPGLEARRADALHRAIAAHSAFGLPEGLDDEQVTYCDILRDADKIDIFRVNCDTPLEAIYNVTKEALRTSAVSEAVKQCFIDRTTVLRNLKKTPADYIVGHICLLNGLKYPVSRRIAREQGYADRLAAFRSENPDTEAWFTYMRAHLWDHD